MVRMIFKRMLPRPSIDQLWQNTNGAVTHSIMAVIGMEETHRSGRRSFPRPKTAAPNSDAPNVTRRVGAYRRLLKLCACDTADGRAEARNIRRNRARRGGYDLPATSRAEAEAGRAGGVLLAPHSGAGAARDGRVPASS